MKNNKNNDKIGREIDNLGKNLRIEKEGNKNQQVEMTNIQIIDNTSYQNVKIIKTDENSIRIDDQLKNNDLNVKLNEINDRNKSLLINFNKEKMELIEKMTNLFEKYESILKNNE